MTRVRFFLLIIILTGCTPSKQRNEYLTAYHGRDFVVASAGAAKAQRRNDPAWALLDRGTIALAAGNSDAALTFFYQALNAIDHYKQSDIGETVGKILLQDEVGAWSGAPYQHVLASFYFALALIESGDIENAGALLRKCEELQQEYAITLPPAKLLFGTLLERQGNLSNAHILLGNEPNPKATTLIVIGHNGCIPRIISTWALPPESALLLMDCAPASPPIIPLPAICPWENGDPIPLYVRVNGYDRQLQCGYDVAAAQRKHFDKNFPGVAARALGRYLLREAVAKKAEGVAGLIALTANLCTKADTREWGTLPARIDTLRVDLSPGEHTINNKTISLEAGELYLLNIFYTGDYP